MKIKILKTISLILMIMNVYLAFFICGAPKEIFGHTTGLIGAYDPYDIGRRVIRLKSDAVAISEDGKEVVYEAGSELEVIERNSDGSLVTDGKNWCPDASSENLQGTRMTFSDLEYEEVDREEFRLRIKKDQERRRREDNMSRWMWYLYPDSHGNVARGIKAALAVAIADGAFFVFCKRSGNLTGFIVVNVILCLFVFVFGLGHVKSSPYR